MISQILKLFGIRVTSTVVHKIAVDVGSIDDETALRYGPFYRGIMTIAGDVSQLPLYVYKRIMKEEVKDKTIIVWQDF